MKTNKIYQGDCREKLKELDDNSIDSIVTDPPYELGFMGKSWDATGIAYNIKMWKECLRVLKPGGHLLSFGGTRTYHRMTCAIEDAGFEIRDQIMWLYGSGFPKSHNIGKAVDKIQGNKRNVVGENQNVKGRNIRNIETLNVGAGAGNNTEITKGNSKYEGWGTALKPAHEPICMARKPLTEKTVAQNVLKWGTGGINIDECRVEYQSEDDFNSCGMKFIGDFRDKSKGRFPANLIHDNSEEVRECFPETGSPRKTRTAVKGGCKGALGNFGGSSPDAVGTWPEDNGGNASRFFKSIIYQAKASKSERNIGCDGLEEKDKAGKDFRPNHAVKAELGEDGNPFGRWGKIKNNHPTVKPIALMEYLIKLVTPKGGTVLDPFMGSGSTGCACKEEGFEFIGIEQDKEYCKIAEARVNSVVQQKKLL